MASRLHRAAQQAIHVAVLCTALINVPVAASSTDMNLPVLGERYSASADASYEYRLGQAWLRHLRGSTTLWPDSDVRDYVESIINRLAQQTPLRGQRFDVVIVGSPEINAFAVPGGVIGINTGLILNADSEDEVASVLAHELGHISQRHFARSQEANQYNQWLALAGLLASIAVAASGGGGDGIMAAGASAQAIAAQNQLAYSRNFEQEADRIGLQTLVASDYDGHAMPAFFQKLDRKTQQLGYMPEFLRTHPLSSSRLSDLKRRVYDLKALPLREQIHFDLIKARLQVAYQPDLAKYIDTLKLRTDPLSRYALALAYLRQQQPDAAREIATSLLKQQPSQLSYQLLDLDAQLQKQRYSAVLSSSLQQLKLSPNNQSLLQRAYRAAIALNQPNSVRDILHKAIAQRPNDPVLWEMLADTATRSGDALTTFRARAEQLFFTNRLAAAEVQLNNAIRLANNNYSLRAQLQARLKTMRELDSEFR